MSDNSNDSDGIEYYHYDPTMVGAVIFIVLFLATTILHCYQLLRTKVWFMIPFTIGGCCKCLAPPPGNRTASLEVFDY